MNPGFDVRLTSMHRAMATVIIPAIDPENQLAIEQAALMLGHIGILAAQWDKVDDYSRLCLGDILAVARALRAGGGPATTEAAVQLQGLAQSPASRAEHAYQAIAGALEALVRAADVDGDEAFRRTLHQQVLLHANRQAARDRAWFVACGFDVNTKDLPSLDELVGRTGVVPHGS